MPGQNEPAPPKYFTLLPGQDADITGPPIMMILKVMLLSLLQSQQVGCTPDCTVTAPRIATVLALDAHLGEAEWGLSQPARGFTQVLPQEGAPATDATQVRLLHDGRILYIGARMYDTEADRIRSAYGRRDLFDSANWFSVALDPYGDGLTTFRFAVNAAGVRAEGLQVAGTPDYAPDHPMGFDTAWDAEWQAGVRVDSTGWTVEMAIPLKVIELTGRMPARLSVNFSRFVAHRWELSQWAETPAKDRLSGAVTSNGILNLTGTTDPGVYRSAVVLLNAFRLNDGSDNGAVLAIPLPGAEAELALTPVAVAHAALIPDFIPESFREYLQSPFFPDLRSYALPRMFAASQRYLSSPAILGNSVFHHPVWSKDDELMLGAAALRGRLPGRISYAGAGVVTTRDFDRFDQGFVGRLRQRVRRGSSVGISTAFGAHGPIRTTTLATTQGRTEEEHAPWVRAVAVDWDLRAGNKALTGQGMLSKAIDNLLTRTVWETTPDGYRLISEERLRQQRATERGFAAQIQYEQRRRSLNWYGGLALADSGINTGPYGRRGLTDRLVAYSGIDYPVSALLAYLHELEFTAELAQQHRWVGWGYRETQVSLIGTLLTRSFNRIVISLRVNHLADHAVSVAADIAGSTDLRNRWVVRPKAAIHAEGAFRWNASATAKGRLGRVLTVDLAGGLEGRRSSASDSRFRHLSVASLSGYRSAATLAYFAAWQAYPWIGFSLPAYDPYGIERGNPSRFSFGRAGAGLVMGPRVELELGTAVRASVNLNDSRADVFVRLSWEYKEASRLQFGFINTWLRNFTDRTNPASLSTLFASSQERLYMLRITRKIWR